MLSSCHDFEDAVESEEWLTINEPEVRKRVQNRLSQRKHRASSALHIPCHRCKEADHAPGDKIRQQRALESQEIILPPSFPSSCNIEAGPGTADFPTSLRPFHNQDDRANFTRPAQSQDGFETFDGITSQELLAPEQDVPPTMGHRAQSGPSGYSPSTASPIGRHRVNSTSQSAAMPLASLGAPPSSMPADSRNEYWMNMSSSDPPWPMSGFHHPSTSLPKVAGNNDNAWPNSNHVPRPVSRPSPRRTISSSSQPQINIPPTPRISEAHQSPGWQKHFTNQPYHKASHQAASSESESRSSRGTCTHCGSSRPTDNFEGHKSEYASPKTPASTPSRGSIQTSSTDEVDIMSSCGKILANLARESEENTEREQGQRSRNNRRKRSRSSVDNGSPRSDRHSQDEGHREGSRHNVVEKVVILCLKDGKLTKY